MSVISVQFRLLNRKVWAGHDGHNTKLFNFPTRRLHYSCIKILRTYFPFQVFENIFSKNCSAQFTAEHFFPCPEFQRRSSRHKYSDIAGTYRNILLSFPFSFFFSLSNRTFSIVEHFLKNSKTIKKEFQYQMASIHCLACELLNRNNRTSLKELIKNFQTAEKYTNR